MDPKNPNSPGEEENKKRLERVQSTTQEMDDDESAARFLSEMLQTQIDDKFNMSLVHGDEHEIPSKHFNERDYQFHRRESFPHIHQPLKPLHSRSIRKKLGSSSTHVLSRQTSNPEQELTSADLPNKNNSSKTIEKYPDEKNADMDETFESCPLLHQCSEINGSSVESTEKTTTTTPVLKQGKMKVTNSSSDFFSGEMSETTPKKVQFELGGSPFNSFDEDDGVEKRKHKSHHHHKSHTSKYQNPQWRLRQGSESNTSSPIRTPGTLPLYSDISDNNMSILDELDTEEATMHRFGDTKGFRRHKFISREDSILEASPIKRSESHKTHEIFVELDELCGSGDDRQWKETSRWIKYEEHIEYNIERWGKPRMSTLGFHNLIDLRRLIEKGVCLLDLKEKDLPGIVYRVADQLVLEDLLNEEDRGLVMRTLLLKHKHLDDNDKKWKFLRRNTTSGSLTSVTHSLEERHKAKSSPVHENVSTITNGRRNSIGNGHTNGMMMDNNNEFSPNRPLVDISKLSSSNLSHEDMKKISNKEGILRKVPEDAEASVVLVGKLDSLSKPSLVFVRLNESVYIPITEAPLPVLFLFIIMCGANDGLDLHEIGRSIATVMSNKSFHDVAYKCTDRKELLKGVHTFLDESSVIPPFFGDWEDELFPYEELRERNLAIQRRKKRQSIAVSQMESEIIDTTMSPISFKKDIDPLKRSGKLFGGFINDIRRRYPLYFSDLKDGINMQCFASIIFIYFAAVSGAIAFGGVLSDKTEKHIGISETLLATSIGGVLFSMLAGQPLIIIGPTGTLLLYEVSLYTFCKQLDVDFLAVRFYIGLWLVVIGLVATCFEASFIARYITRFTQEIYSSLVSLLFIMEAVNKLANVFQSHPLQPTYEQCSWNDTDDGSITCTAQPNTALLSAFLCIGTFAIGYLCRSIRNSKYFVSWIRSFLGNFGVPISIIAMVMVAVDYALGDNVLTEKLAVPEGLQNTKPERSYWLVTLSTPNSWMPFACAVPALLLFILLFIETNICELIIGNKDRKLKKGLSFHHLDVLLLCLINAGVSCFGGCYLVAASLRAVTHTTSLTIYSTNDAPGEKPKLLGVHEQRVTAFLVSILIFFSVWLSSILALIPISCLFGVFLYMGISSMTGIQFLRRVGLLMKTVENHPQVPYVRKVKTLKMNAFTIIQIICLALLWSVKYSILALGFPLLIAMLIPVRYFILPRFFEKYELKLLDANGTEDHDDHDFDDFDERCNKEEKDLLVVHVDKSNGNMKVSEDLETSPLNEKSNYDFRCI